MTADRVRLLPAAVAWRSSAAPPVVFTNGVCDLLRPGHVLALEEARALGGLLHLVRRAAGYSTTAIIERIRATP